jgi:transposase
MNRHGVTDVEWNAIRVLLPRQRSGNRGRPWADHRLVISGIFWILATGAPWRDLPDEFGSWQTVYKRFRRWCKSGLWQRVWNKLVNHLRRNNVISYYLWMVDGSIVRAHHASVGGSKKTSTNAGENALGKSRGGYSCKLHIVCDDQGIPIGIVVTPGQINEPTVFHSLMDSIPFNLRYKTNRPKALAGDKAYVAGYIFQWIQKLEIENVIPNRKNENKNPGFCKKTYRLRNVVERLIGKLKQFRRIATRYEKTVESYLSMIYLAFTRIILRTI